MKEKSKLVEKEKVVSDISKIWDSFDYSKGVRDKKKKRKALARTRSLIVKIYQKYGGYVCYDD